jgi:hypothetical protein
MNQCRFIPQLGLSMSVATVLSLPLMAGLVALPISVPAQTDIRVQFGARLSPESVNAYSRERQGDCLHNYRH